MSNADPLGYTLSHRQDVAPPDKALPPSEQLSDLQGRQCIVATTVDITDRKQVEDRLRASERTLSLFVAQAPAAIAMFDRNMHYIAASQRYMADYRITGQSVIGRSHYDVFPALPARWKAIHRRCLAGATEKAEEDPFPRDDGVLDWMQWEICPWYDEIGEIGGIILFSEVVTDRVRARTERQEHEERFRLMLETMVQGVAFQDANGNLTFANPAAERILGLPLDQLQGRTSLDPRWRAIHEDGSDFPGETHPAMVALRTGKPVRDVVMGIYNPAVDAYRWISINAVPRFRPGADKPYQVYATFDDITERKQAEEALHRSEERFRTAFDNMLEGAQIIGFDWRYLYLNATALAHSRRSKEELLGSLYTAVWPDSEDTHLFAMLQRCMEDRIPCRMQNEFIYADGAVRWFELSIQPIPEGIFVLSIDITERKQARQDLLELNRTLEKRIAERTAEVQDLYDHAPAGYHSLDAEGRFIRINQTELDWLGYTRAEVLGRRFVDFVTPASQAVFSANFHRFLETGYIRDLEFDLLRKDGATLRVLVNATAVCDAEGRYLLSRSTVFDNSARKQAEDALRLANVEMARAVRLKDEFLANMSHELRTPLTGMLALGENLQEQIYGPLNERQLRTLGHIETSSRHLLSLINDLLDLSKIEAGGLVLELHPLVVDDITQASMLFVKEMAHKKNIGLSSHNDQPHTIVVADARRLKQMLVNLLGNAVKFTPEGGRVHLHVIPDAAAQEIRFLVKDTGIGIPPEAQARLFQPFTQLDSALSRQYEGTGLGLALVKRLAVQHGGSVSVASTGIPGDGSCFTLTLPYTPG